jgi:putative addiction module component (TIGR02574 family)
VAGSWRRLARSAESRYIGNMESAEKLLEQAMLLPADEREELAARLLDSLEPPPGISIEDREELEARAAEARRGAPGVAWDDLKRTLSK